MSRKTPPLTRRSTGIVASRRRRTRRPTWERALLQPDVLEAHHAIGNRVVVLHPRRERLRLDGVDNEDHRQLLLEESGELTEEPLALGLSPRPPRLFGEGVVSLF